MIVTKKVQTEIKINNEKILQVNAYSYEDWRGKAEIKCQIKQPGKHL